MEFSCYEVLDFSWSGGTDIGEAVDLRVDCADCFYPSCCSLRQLLYLSNNKREGKDKLVVVG